MSDNSDPNKESKEVDNQDLPQDSWGSIEFAFKYPFTNSDSKYGGILVGALMLLASFIVVPIFTFNGYVFKLKEYAATGEKEAPKFDDWGQLTNEGFSLF